LTLKSEVHVNVIIETKFVPRRKHTVADLLTLCKNFSILRVIWNIYSHILRKENAEFFSVTASGTYKDHCALLGQCILEFCSKRIQDSVAISSFAKTVNRNSTSQFLLDISSSTVGTASYLTPMTHWLRLCVCILAVSGSNLD
jgi:hypothetical protein